MVRTAWAALVALGLVAAPAYGQVKLEWKFKEGEKFYVEEVSTMKQNIEVAGKKIDQTQKQTILTSYTVKKKAADETVLVSNIEAVDVKTQGGFGGDMGMEKIMQNLKGASFTITLGPGGKVTKFEGYDEFIKKLSDGNDEVGKFIKTMITEEVLKKGSEEAFAFVPDKAVDKGDAWKRESVVPFGPLGSFKSVSNYTMEGKDDGNAKVSYKSNMTYTPPKGEGALGGLFKITKGNLKSEGAKGTILFDVEKGRLVSNNFAMAFRGSLTMDVMGNTIDMDVSMDQNSTVRVLDRVPAKKDDL